MNEHLPIALTVEVDLALSRPPRVDTTIRVMVVVSERTSRTSIEVDAEMDAIGLVLATRDSGSVMAVGARVIDFTEL